MFTRGPSGTSRCGDSRLTPAEQGLYKAVINFVRETYRRAGKGYGVSVWSDDAAATVGKLYPGQWS